MQHVLVRLTDSELLLLFPLTLSRHTHTDTHTPVSLPWAARSCSYNKRQVTKQPELEFQDPRGLFELEHPTGP